MSVREVRGTIVALCAVIAGIVFGVSCTSPPEATAWQYEVRFFGREQSAADVRKSCDALGALGFELSGGLTPDPLGYYAVFKRPVTRK